MADAVISSTLCYRDPAAALAWLERAFGFETELLVSGPDGGLVFARAAWNGVAIEVGGESPPGARSPASLEGCNTQGLHVRFSGDIDAHLARARAAGAVILREPRQEFYGDLTYMASDLEGHLWTFAQPMPDAGGPPPEGWTVRFPRRQPEGASA